MEIWKPILNYQRQYEISSHGRVRSINRTVNSAIRHNKSVVKKGKTLKQNPKRNGYLTVDLCKDNIKKTSTVHRLAALAFIPNPDDKPQVNHINGIKTDNSVDNLEWVTPQENQWHRHEVLGHTGKRKPIKCLETRQVHASSKHAAMWLNETKYGHSKQQTALARKIRKCCVGEKPIAYGYHWEYVL